MKVAIVHYWLVGMRGGEKVVQALLDIYPQADIYTHVFDPEAVSPDIAARVKGTTFISRLPMARKLYQRYLPLMPMALEMLDLRGYDLVISSESGPAKGVLTSPDTRHVCYCHTPMRYLWEMFHDYREQAGVLTRTAMAPLTHYLRLWDQASANRVDAFIANSRNVRARIRKHYRRESEVIHPPVDVERFSPDPGGKPGDYYLFLGQLVRYKRCDLAVKACTRLGKRLLVAGKGAELKHLRALAGPTVEFLGHVDDADLPGLYAGCRALLFPGQEDFGIVPVEAMASGRPVIAYGKGGALETVIDGQTGLLFSEQSPDSLMDAMQRSETLKFDPETLVAHASRFAPGEFKSRFTAFMQHHADI